MTERAGKAAKDRVRHDFLALAAAQEALVQEAADAGYDVGEPFQWPFFQGEHYTDHDGRGYGVMIALSTRRRWEEE